MQQIHNLFIILSDMCFLVFFYVAGKPNMQGEYAFNIFPVWFLELYSLWS